MKYATIKYNDVANAPGIAISVYLQGCPHHCKNCFNPETWDFNGGQEFTYQHLQNIIDGLYANGIERSLCILGGEPLCEQNLFLTNLIINEVKNKAPNVKIYIWTGYVLEELQKSSSAYLKNILEKANFLIDGPFIDEQKDLSLQMRGSRNQRVIDLKSLTN